MWVCGVDHGKSADGVGVMAMARVMRIWGCAASLSNGCVSRGCPGRNGCSHGKLGPYPAVPGALPSLLIPAAPHCSPAHTTQLTPAAPFFPLHTHHPAAPPVHHLCGEAPAAAVYHHDPFLPALLQHHPQRLEGAHHVTDVIRVLGARATSMCEVGCSGVQGCGGWTGAATAASCCVQCVTADREGAMPLWCVASAVLLGCSDAAASAAV